MSSVDDLVAEAEHLWAAEQNSEERTSNVSGSWGCIALLMNPKSRNAARLIDGWAKHIARESHYGKLDRARGESTLVDTSGQIAIPWPQRKDRKSIGFDILLMTATDPTITNGQYPLSSEIAAAWKTPSGSPHINYFWNNRKHGIQTFQDVEIEVLLKSKES